MNLHDSIAFVLCISGAALGQDWSQFRGPRGQGIATGKKLPTSFSKGSVRWRVAAGRGHSSPVVWKKRIYLTRVADGGGEREVVAFDLASGKEVWQAESSFEGHRQHRFNSFASATPAVDGDGIYVVWTNGRNVVAMALDHDGKETWKRELGTFAASHGSATSPVLFGDRILVANENAGDDSFLMALDKKTGKTAWRVDRTSMPRRTAYATPVVRETGGKAIALFASTAHGLAAVAPDSGKLLWEINPKFRQRVVATAAVNGDHVLLVAGSGGGGKESALVKVPTEEGARPEIVARPRRNLPYVPSALPLGKHFFLVSDGGVASCLAAVDGEQVWRARLDGTFYSSPVSDGATVYVVSREGKLFAFPAEDRFELLDSFELGGPVSATPAIVDGMLLVRTHEELLCLARRRKRG